MHWRRDQHDCCSTTMARIMRVFLIKCQPKVESVFRDGVLPHGTLLSLTLSRYGPFMTPLVINAFRTGCI
jgi:hypothetical protein